MSNSFSYADALQSAESRNRASTKDARSVTDMSLEELNEEHARATNATRAQMIRDELKRRGS